MATFVQYKDEMKTCPYNHSHKVSSRRFVQHIVKCQKDLKSPILKICPYNASHRISVHEYEDHILNCKDSRQIIREIASNKIENDAYAKVEIIKTPQQFNSNENWDEEMEKDNFNSYVLPGLEQLDDKSIQETPMQLKTPLKIQRLKKSQRKQYYKLILEQSKEEIKNSTEKITENNEETLNLNRLHDKSFECDQKLFLGIGRGLPVSSFKSKHPKKLETNNSESKQTYLNSNTLDPIKQVRDYGMSHLFRKNIQVPF